MYVHTTEKDVIECSMKKLSDELKKTRLIYKELNDVYYLQILNRIPYINGEEDYSKNFTKIVENTM